jgi:hypothetical protein
MFTITSSHGMPLDEPLVLPVPDTAAWREVEAQGMDVKMLYDSWRMTPEERIREHAAALNSAVSMRESFQKQYAEFGRTA